MTRYRKKQDEVEAIQFSPGLWGVNPALCKYYDITYDEQTDTLRIGRVVFKRGEYAIRYPDGTIAIFPKEDFEAVYEPVKGGE